MAARLEWFGCATFRLRIRGLTLFFDTYLDGDRVPGSGIVGLSVADVDDADFVFVSHAHFDHMLGADRLAARTGATVIGSYEVARTLAGLGVDEAQLLRVAGGEPVDCGNDVRVRVFPSLHSCLFAHGAKDTATECLGDLGISAQERDARAVELLSMAPLLGEPIASWSATNVHRSSLRDGGQFAYLVECPDGAIWVSSSAGYWSGIVRNLRPNVALLAASGRPNVDGEPYQGSLARFILDEVEMLRPDEVIFSHHDALMPPVLTETDTDEAESLLRDHASYASLTTLDYGAAHQILK